MFEKLKDVLFYGFGGMVSAIPFMAVLGSVYHFTDFFKAMRLDWNIIVLYCGACGGAFIGIWMTKKSIRSQLFTSTKEEVLRELNK